MRGYLLEEHELLVVMVGGSLGKIGLVTAAILPALLNQNMWRLKPYSDRLDFRFLKLVLYDLNENRLQITKSTHGHLAMGTYAAAKVPFPPLAEQHRIVAKVDQLMALVDELERQQAASREKASNLLDAIVQEMTSGG
jgi:type I restriction enzyme S subunit